MSLQTRREWLGLAGAAVLGGGGLRALAAGAAAKETLRVAAARIGVRYGSDSDMQFAHAPPEYAALFAEQCELYAPNLSWATVTPNRGGADPLREESNVAFAAEHGLKLTGFHLLWHLRTPKWVEELTSADEMRTAIADHIAAMGRHYGDRVYSWNVANESLSPGWMGSKERRADNLCRTPVYEKLGLGVFDHAFRAAQAALPKALRVYNDYALEMDNRDQETKRRALLGLIDAFQRNGTPIDAVGLQSHLRLDGSKFNEPVYRQFLRDIASRGLKILITELDVLDLGPESAVATRDRNVADMYGRFLSVALDEPATVAVVTWGLCDKYTWLMPKRGKNFSRADGQPSRPLPFDETLTPKPTYYAILQAFQNAPPRGGS